MPEFTARGDVTLRGVTFFIEAENEAEARRKISNGFLFSYETEASETVDWKIEASTLEENT